MVNRAVEITHTPNGSQLVSHLSVTWLFVWIKGLCGKSTGYEKGKAQSNVAWCYPHFLFVNNDKRVGKDWYVCGLDITWLSKRCILHVWDSNGDNTPT